MRLLKRLSKLTHWNSNTGLKRWCCLSLVFFCLFSVLTNSLYAAPTKEHGASLLNYLTQEKEHLNSDVDELKQLALPINGKEYDFKKKTIATLITLNNAKIESLQGFLDNESKLRFDLNQKLKHIQQLPLASADESVQDRVSAIEDLLVANKKIQGLIADNLELAQIVQKSLHSETQKLDLWHTNYLLEQKLLQIKDAKKALNKELGVLYNTDITTGSSEHPGVSTKAQIDYEASALINNQHIALIHYQLNMLNLQKKLIKAKIVLIENSNSKTLQYINEAYSDTINQYAGLETRLQDIVVFLTKEEGLGLGPQFKKSIAALKGLIMKQINAAHAERQILASELVGYEAQLKKLVSARQTLSEYSVTSWPHILKKLSAIPSLFYLYLKTLTLKVYDSYLWLGVLPLSILWGSIFLIASVFYGLNSFLKSLSPDQERSRLTGYLYDGVLTIIQRNTLYLSVFCMAWVLLCVTNISFSNYQLLFNLGMVWVTFRILILIARLALLERISDSSGKDVKLYYRLKWLLLFGGWTTALMTFSHLLPLSLLIQDIFNRLFMLFILTVSLVAWKSKDVISYLLLPVITGKKRYIKNAIFILVTLVPVTLFSTAVIGLFGFVNLAWTLSSYQADALIVLVAYILSRGLLFDALEYLSEWMISSLNNGWLWIEVFLKPLDKIMRLVLLVASTEVLFQLFGWHSDSVVIQRLKEFAYYTIINVSGIHITVVSTLEFLFLLAIFVWASKWTREFCYRWLFKSAKDAGIRNSLSVFTQYAVILIGSFIALRVLGLDFSGMSMILGGLAVGMGFGLRDFASNIVGGIMLLIERPVREGDLITIGEYEGQVSHIGIRSMRVSSWDNTEVLIPNAETFNKPFTNWTHQDSIIRTVIPIKVSRSDDPVMVQQLIFDVLAVIPEIVPDPPAQVYLKKIDEALIEFEVRYFMNVQIHTRVEVRSKVLFAITAQFKQAGIRPPVEPITIEFKEGHGEFFAQKSAAID